MQGAFSSWGEGSVSGHGNALGEVDSEQGRGGSGHGARWFEGRHSGHGARWFEGRRLALSLLVVVALAAAACSPASVLSGGSALTGAQPSSKPHYPIGNVWTGWKEELVAPGSIPPGADVWSCKPNKSHPYPVVLVHGTFANMAFSWQALSPMLADAGYCVYALNYGVEPESLGRFDGLAPIQDSAKQLAAFVNKVLAATGAKKVDIVGHSQGGMMPRYYIDDLGGASKVNMLVGLAPSNHGTTLDGLVDVLRVFQKMGFPKLSMFGCEACQQQEIGSSFLKSLNKGGGTVPSVKYVVIESKYDEVVTPYTSAFLSGPNVWDITLQNYCSQDFTEHLGIIYDPVALQFVMNALGPDSHSFRPHCSFVPPVFS
jgi:triacylglycerol esterase/lipase EstA (alpha/beta hydrolase family)